MEQRITLITLGVRDLAAARRFYVDGLGWKPAPGGNEDVTFIECGAVILSLWSRDSLAEDANVPNEGGGFGGIALAHNVRDRASVDRVLQEAEAAGAKIARPAKEVFWGGYSGYFTDPDGHLWEVAHNPHWPLDSAGYPQLSKQPEA
jgi:catechol 2,3-dioxygenase-like lactoylglutathione lyase family enzyme